MGAGVEIRAQCHSVLPAGIQPGKAPCDVAFGKAACARAGKCGDAGSFYANRLGTSDDDLFVSVLPVVELRGGLPNGIALGLDYPLALTAVVLENMVPVPLIILYIRHVFQWLRRHCPWWHTRMEGLDRKARLKGWLARKHSVIGLCALVAIPLPGTSAWTGVLAAAVLDMRPKNAVPTISPGVCIAGAIMAAVTFGIISIL